MEGYLILENGDHFEGVWPGCTPDQGLQGEVIFYTGMTGYQEVITDPSFNGKIVVFTYPLIGNCGINDDSVKPQVSGVVISEYSDNSHHYEATSTMSAYLNKWNIPVLAHADTRAVVKRLRMHGVMGGALVTTKQGTNLESFQLIKDKQLIKNISTKEIESYGIGDYHVVLIDFGYKRSILSSLNHVGCRVTIVPYNTPFEKIQSLQPDGIMLSNGPGNPKEMASNLQDIRKLIQAYPTLAICLGHQLTALAFGGETKKLRFGHHGANQPVIDLMSKKVFMTSQNHTFVVDESSLQGTGFIVRYLNVNDKSVEGIAHKSLPIISVQFHPEAHPGLSDCSAIYEDFVGLMQSVRREEVYA